MPEHQRRPTLPQQKNGAPGPMVAESAVATVGQPPYTLPPPTKPSQ